LCDVFLKENGSEGITVPADRKLVCYIKGCRQECRQPFAVRTVRPRKPPETVAELNEKARSSMKTAGNRGRTQRKSPFVHENRRKSWPSFPQKAEQGKELGQYSRKITIFAPN